MNRRRLRANGREDGIGKAISPESASSARNRSGPRSAYFHKGPRRLPPHHEAGHTSAPDHMLGTKIRFHLHSQGASTHLQ